MTNYLALDVGAARIGLALANDIARIAAPLPALTNDEQTVDVLRQLITENDISTVVVGLPRGLDGQDTAQTDYVRQFTAGLTLSVDLVWQDEALTSVKAEQELEQRGKPYGKADIDSLSAVYILDDYLNGVH